VEGEEEGKKVEAGVQRRGKRWEGREGEKEGTRGGIGRGGKEKKEKGGKTTP